LLIPTTAIYGLSSSHLVDYQGYKLQQDTAVALAKMSAAAKGQGIDMRICSGYRSFAAQLKIWNTKALGKRTLLDIDSHPASITNKSEKELVELILLWSALPGTSRHHWGTDVDLYDANTIESKDLRLVTSEYQALGPCANLHTWLAKHSYEFGFYFPFQQGLSGVSPEPWHLSFFPVADQYLNQFELDKITSILDDTDIELKEVLMARIPDIVKEYVHRVAPSPTSLGVNKPHLI